MRLRVHNVELGIDVPDAARAGELRRALARRLRVDAAGLGAPHIVRRALDVRGRRPRLSYLVDISVAAALGQRLCRRGVAAAAPPPSAGLRLRLRRVPDGPRPVVVGAGPAGLFAALTLAEAGWPARLIERGAEVGQRGRDVARLYAYGELKPESNVCFGEGGAGTFSDGKLYTRVGDARVDAVLAHLVALGAAADIAVDARPHLGTDRLVTLLRALRARLLDLGTEIAFDTRVDGIALRAGALAGLSTAAGEAIDARHVILASGHSARDVWELLAAAGLPLQLRPFAVGFRVEHPQAAINAARYGAAAAAAALPAADYRLVHNEAQAGERRGVYSFCMCPGGVVVTTPTEPGRLCINGMSHAARRGRFANSALVVTCGPADFAAAGFEGPFAGADFQAAIERRAFVAGGGNYAAPAARLAAFAAGRRGDPPGRTSYRRGLTAADLGALMPAPIVAALRAALPHFGRTLPGFVTDEATLIGVETRTAAPLRLPRGADGCALGADGLYPAGEGMGFGGGIVSAAVDGIRAAEALLGRVGARPEAAPVAAAA